MRRFWELVYDIVIIPLLWLVLQCMGMFIPKVQRAIKGRKNLFPALEVSVAKLRPGVRVWFHSSSMGEFEQAKPIIAELKARHPEAVVIASFFSPSGYEHSRKYPLADLITYVPFDTPAGVRRYLELVKPDVAVMVRYDIWPNLIWELDRRGIPSLIANATMRRQSKRFIPVIRSFHRHVYDAMDEILTVSANDVAAFKKFALRRARVLAVGDTRYDQVSIRSAEAKKRHIIPPAITAGKKVLVIGSSWPEDEEVVIPAFLELQRTMKDLLILVVPHEPTVEHIEDLEQEFEGQARTIRFSGLNEYQGEPVILVDSIGVLLILYSLAHIAYVGGSFRQGIHNVLEAAVYGLPVVFGPRHRNSQEPLMLVEKGGGFVVNDGIELLRTLRNLLEDDTARTTAGARAAKFVQSHTGATTRFLEHLEPHLHTS